MDSLFKVVYANKPPWIASTIKSEYTRECKGNSDSSHGRTTPYKSRIWKFMGKAVPENSPDPQPTWRVMMRMSYKAFKR